MMMRISVPFFSYRSSRYCIKHKCASIIKDQAYCDALEELYNYFNNSRHCRFHASQILINTNIIEDKTEADQILNDVIDLIEKTSCVI